MKYTTNTVEEYIDQLPEERKEPMQKLRQLALEKLPAGFEETMAYNMITYVVPLSLYPKGYMTTPGEPLPFVSIGSQKNYIALYHLGIYGNPTLSEWFAKAYSERVEGKLDMGKGCIRLKKIERIPYELLGELLEKVTPEAFVEQYENALAARKK